MKLLNLFKKALKYGGALIFIYDIIDFSSKEFEKRFINKTVDLNENHKKTILETEEKI